MSISIFKSKDLTKLVATEGIAALQLKIITRTRDND